MRETASADHPPREWADAAYSLIQRLFFGTLKLALVVLAGYVLFRLRAILIVVAVSALVAFSVAPAVDWLANTRLFRRLNHHSRRGVAAGIIFLLLAFGLVELCVLVIKPLSTEIQQITKEWPASQERIVRSAKSLKDWYAALPDGVREWVEGLEWGQVGARIGEQVQHLVLRGVESGMAVVELILIPVLAFSFLVEGRPLKHEFARILPRARVRDGLQVLRHTGQILSAYAVGQLILALIAGGVVYFMLVILGVKYALAMSVLAAVTRVIPVVGPLLGAIPILTLCLLQSPHKAVVVLIGFSLMHLVESKVVMPRIIGSRIKLHPALVIIVLLVGAEFFGMWGMFLAAPAAAIVRALFDQFAVRPRQRAAELRRAQARKAHSAALTAAHAAAPHAAAPDAAGEHPAPRIAGAARRPHPAEAGDRH